MQSPLNTYRNTEVKTSNRLDVLVMLYEGVVRFMNQAHGCLKNGDLEGKGVNISKSLAIINEFKSTLCYDHDRELATNLERLYNFIEDRLIYSNIHNDPKSLLEAMKITVILRDSWKQLREQEQGKAVSPINTTNENNYFRISV